MSTQVLKLFVLAALSSEPWQSGTADISRCRPSNHLAQAPCLPHPHQLHRRVALFRSLDRQKAHRAKRSPLS